MADGLVSQRPTTSATVDPEPQEVPPGDRTGQCQGRPSPRPRPGRAPGHGRLLPKAVREKSKPWTVMGLPGSWRPSMFRIQGQYILGTLPSYMIFHRYLTKSWSRFRAYSSQFFSAEYAKDEPQTYISSPGSWMRSSDAIKCSGKMIGVLTARKTQRKGDRGAGFQPFCVQMDT